MTIVFGGSFTFPKVYVTTPILKGPTITEVYLTVIYTGDIIFRVTANSGINWETLNLTSGIRKKHAFANTGTDFRFMAIGNPGAKITTTLDTYGSYDEPGIKIEFTGTS